MKRILALAALCLALPVCACACAKARAEGLRAAAPAAPAAAPSGNADAVAEPGQKTAGAPGEQTIQGELVNLACYLDHGAKGESHKACGTTCALKGLPIGLLDKDNKITIVVGAHERPMNTELAGKMGTTIQLTGKIVSRDGVKMIEVSRVE